MEQKREKTYKDPDQATLSNAPLTQRSEVSSRKSSSRGQATRERVLEAAFNLFAARGYHAVSVRDIAAAVGIKDASLYNHFPSKQALFDTMVERALERLRRFFVPRGVLVVVGDDVSPYDVPLPEMAEQVLASFQPFFEDEYLIRLRKLLVISQYESDEARRVYRLIFFERPQALQASVFEHLMATGKFPLEDVSQMTLEFYGPVFLLLHANVNWETAKPRLRSHIKRFAEARQVAAARPDD